MSSKEVEKAIQFLKKERKKAKENIRYKFFGDGYKKEPLRKMRNIVIYISSMHNRHIHIPCKL